MQFTRKTLTIVISMTLSNLAVAADDEATELSSLEVEGRSLDDFQQTVIAPGEQSYVPVDPGDLLKYAPGAAVNKNGPLTGIEQYRGMYGSRVNTLVNGLNVAPAGPNWMDPPLSYIPTAALSEITVIRGISPVSAGSETVGGTIIANSRRGEFGIGEAYGFHGIVGAGGESANGGLNGNALLWLSNAKNRFQLSGTYLDTDDYDAGDDISVVPSKAKRWNIGAAYGFQQGDRELNLSYDFDKTEDTGSAALPMDIIYVDADSFNADFKDVLGQVTFEARFHYIEADHEMDNYSLRSPPRMFSGMAMRRVALTDSDDIAYDLRGEMMLGAGDIRFGTDGWFAGYNANVYSPDNEMFQVQNYNDISRDRFGFFAEWDGSVANNLGLVTGARYTRVNSDADQVSASGLMMNQGNADKLAASFNAADRSQEDNLFDLAAVLTYRVSESTSIELGAAHKQRAPSYQERYLWLPLESTAGLADRRVYVGDVELDPETAYNFDLGLNYTSASAYFTPRVFYKRVDDYIQGTPLTSGAAVDFRWRAVNGQKGPGFCQANPGNPACVPLQFSNVDAELYGADAGFGLTFSDRLRLDGNISYVRGKRRDISDNLYRIAPLNSIVGLTYTTQRWSLTAEGEFFAGQDEVSKTNAEEATSGYGLLNLYGEYGLQEDWQIRFGLRNAFDRFYQNHLSGYNRVSADADGNSVDLAVNERLPGAGRSLFLQADYRF
ncbi:MAG: TonB-dependent receptor [bacterium]